MNRRKFLTLSAGAASYSVFVRADGLSGAKPSLRQMSDRFDEIAPPDPSDSRAPSEPHMTLVDLECDVFVAGGGMSGVCAAVAAARHGARVLLVQDRSRLGGNSSSEVKMHIVGANIHGSRPGWREGGLIEEFRLDDAVNNPQRSWEMWDLLLYDKLQSEPNVTLLLDTTVYSATVREGTISEVFARCDKTEHLYRVRAKLFLDCTGDSRLAVEAGAEIRRGREGRDEFKESLALDKPDEQTLGSSILFTSRDYGRPMPFRPPAWARKITKEQLRFRSIRSWEYGYWWIEWGGQIDTIRDNERIRFELLSMVMGVWDYIKNSGEHPSSATWAMDWVGMIPGKRESRRIVGPHILTQNDLLGLTGDFEDAVCIGGWPLDDHPPSGLDAVDERPARQIRPNEVYNIPLRSLFSRAVPNLMMAGRNISASHAAFTSTRVMATCSVMGQAAGTAAAFCSQKNLLPAELTRDSTLVSELQQRLLRDDQTIRGVRNQDPLDLARRARVTASAAYEGSPADRVINGWTRAHPGESDNCWAALMTPDGPWIELSWDEPQTLRQIQLTFDTGFQRELTLTADDSKSAKMIRAPQPETIRDYEISYAEAADGERKILARVEGNYQRCNRHEFPPIRARSVRVRATATNGLDIARIFEIRCYS